MNRFVIASLFLLIMLTGCSDRRYTDPLSPEQALESFTLREGFRIELFAAEPHVMDPVDMAFDEQGTLYVVEMPDYPFMPEHGSGNGRIKVLQDNDRDGRIDTAVIFADSLLDATSILPWNGGLIVTAAPHILFLQDTDGDFRADKKEILFSGFFENNSEAQITSLRQGVDNWIYAANNGQAGEVTFSGKPDAPPVSVRGTDFRFRLDRKQFEPETGAAQFGLTMDDWGHRFMTQNTLHIRHAVIPWRYLNRHPYTPAPSPLVNVSDHELEMFQVTPPPYWRAERTRRRQQQYAEQNLDRVEYAEDHFTGASGGTLYAGDAFPKEYYGNIFTGDVAGNLVHRDVLVPLEDSPTFVASRDAHETDREFLASTDPWFRPVNCAFGPDGFLYIVDMYRQHIETPLSIPEDLKEDMDFLNGTDHGRIYRIVPEDAASTTAVVPDFQKMPSAECVGILSNANRWWRMQAHRLLLERQDLSVVPSLQDLVLNNKDARTRLHALYVLEGLNSLEASLVAQAMKDRHPGVRQHAVRLSEQYPQLLPKLLQSIDDSSVWVTFQAALSLGEFSGAEVTKGLAKVLEQRGDDPWFRTAVLSSDAGSSVELMQSVVNQESFSEGETWKIKFLEDLAYVVGARNRAGEIPFFLSIVSSGPLAKNEPGQTASIKGLLKGVGKSEAIPAALKENIAEMKTDTPEDVRKATSRLKELFKGMK